MDESKVNETIEKVKSYGMIGLLGSDGTETINKVAKDAANAIISLSNERIALSTMMLTKVTDDDSWKSVTYGTRFEEGMAVGILVQTIKYKDFFNREDVVRYGPLVRLEHAKALVSILNGISVFRRTSDRPLMPDPWYKKGYAFRGRFIEDYDQIEEVNEKDGFVRFHLSECCERIQ